MQIFCTEGFHWEFQKLSKNKSYKNLESEIIGHFFNKEMAELCNGTRLNGHSDNPYIKKRLNGAGGYRTYFYILIKKECLYFVFVHPKTGSSGYENINDAKKSEFMKDLLEKIQANQLLKMTLDNAVNKIVFTSTRK
jgi:hypothetical protein